ncbi:MAG: hypothetical protein E7319_05720 [Clostridiales bacterium]|nr:hypothetical protein [Clostridiales bacterium]
MRNTMKMRKGEGYRLLSLVLALLMALLSVGFAEETDTDAAEQTGDQITHMGKASVALKVRIEPNKDARGIDSIPKNATVYIIEQTNDEWVKVHTSNTTGYVMVKYITNMQDINDLSVEEVMSPSDLPDGTVPFDAELLPFRDGYKAYLLTGAYMFATPHQESEKITYVSANKEVIVSQVSGDWCYARYQNKEGYMLNSGLYKWDRIDPYAGEIPGLTVMPKIAFITKTAEVYAVADNKSLKDYPVTPGACVAVYEKDPLGRYQTPYHRTMGYLEEDVIGYTMDVVPWDQAQPGDLIAAMTTFYAVGVSTLQYQGRNWNIYLASSMINGTVLQPGQEFNMNETIGPYRKSTGYHEAPIMSQNATTGYGGGTCQVNTTFYMTNIQVPILITHRKVHADVGIYYVPRGFDAAVGGGSINLTLVNTLPYAIRYQFFITDGVMTCCIFRES